MLVLALAVPGAYAEDTAESMSQIIVSLENMRNEILVERFFSDTYEDPKMAVTETVKNTIELYESTKTHQVTVGDLEYFVSNTNPYGPGAVAFDAINSLRSDAEVYPFVVDVASMKVVAEGAFPVTVGLSAVFLNDADRPLENIVEDLKESEGTWVTYTYSNPGTGSYEDKNVWLSLHDGYIFGAGHYLAPDDTVLDSADTESRLKLAVDESIRLYEREGDAAFDTITMMDMTFARQTVYDLQESRVVAAPDQRIVGFVVPLSALGFDRSLEEFLQLYEQGGTWSDRFETNEGGEDLRLSAWSVLHDDRYVFLASHSYSPEVAVVAEVNAAIDLYKKYGDMAFDRITWQSVDPQIIYPFVVDAETWETVAHATVPGRVGACCSQAIAESNDLDDIRTQLEGTAGAWVEYTFYNPISERDEYKRVWLAMHDDYIFGSGYYYGDFDHAAEIIADTVANYDADGDAAFEAVNLERSGNVALSPFVLDYDDLSIVAHGGYPDMVGQGIKDITDSGDTLVAEIRESLMDDGDVTLIPSALLDPQTGQYVPVLIVFQVHDGHIFAAAQLMAIYTK